MEKFEINPFDRSALTDIRMLAGRTAEFTRIRFVMRNGYLQKDRIKSILLSGDRGVGKTSFLNLIEAECKQYNLIPVRLNLTESNSSNSNEFFWYLYSQLINKVFSLGFFGGIGGVVDSSIHKILYTDGKADTPDYVFKTPLNRKSYLVNSNIVFEFDQLIQDIIKIREEVTGDKSGNYNFKTKFYFLVDETQKIYENRKIIEDIRYIVQQQNIGVGFVFAGDQTYQELMWEKVFGGTHREFEVLSLNYFEDDKSVEEYFIKSLETIGWTKEEIETDLFYRFRETCYQIFHLTAGKPAWINIIAMKMYERYMIGDTKHLVFDKQAKLELKEILEKGGQLDKSKLDFIEQLSLAEEKWLEFIFSCELSTFKSVYFYGKFLMLNEFALSKQEYENFCKNLVDKGILNILFLEKTRETIGYKTQDIDFLDNRYFAFLTESDTIKQWLVFSTEGKYRFSNSSPGAEYIYRIYTDFIDDIDKCFKNIVESDLIDDPEEKRFSSILRKVNNASYNIKEASFHEVALIYRFIQRSHRTKNVEILFAYLRDNNTGKYRCWNGYHHMAGGKLGQFRETKSKLSRYTNNVERCNDEKNNFSFSIFIERCEKV